MVTKVRQIVAEFILTFIDRTDIMYCFHFDCGPFHRVNGFPDQTFDHVQRIFLMQAEQEPAVHDHSLR